jgi:LysM repeat protein
MERIFFLPFILYSLLLVVPGLAAAGSQTWKVRPGDSLEIIAMTLDLPKEEIKAQNPGVSESNLQIGQKLKLPLRSHVESKALEAELGKRDERITTLEETRSDLEQKIARTESQLAWHPILLWGFWICFGIIVFIAAGAYWIFRQTHPRVFEQPYDRSIRDLRESQTRVRPSFPQDEVGASSRGGHWQPPLKRLPHAR